MPYRRMGKSGLTLSALALGGWTTYGAAVKDEKTIETIIRAAFERGVNFFDISDVYERGEAEKSMGRVFAKLPRHELVISSKVFWPMSDDVNDKGLSRKHIMESVNKSLKRIGADYLDLYFCHRPDPDTPLEETIRAMDDLVRQGKVLYWGTSEHSGAQIREIAEICATRGCYAPAVEQPQLSLIKRKRYLDEVAPAAREKGLGVVTWSPLASGLLSGKYDNGLPEGSRLKRAEGLRATYLTDENRNRVKKMKAIADEVGCTRSQLAIAWCLDQPGVTSVITGATRPEQLTENLGALKVKLTGDVKSKLEALFVE
ncbi:MAG: aldo/keto reductase [Planctomycetes bacterium]|nr:aldo/keto reductase [Planctomycetota bacterium]